MGVHGVWAGQQPAKGTAPNAGKAQAPAPTKAATPASLPKSTPAVQKKELRHAEPSAKVSAARTHKGETSHPASAHTATAGKRDPFKLPPPPGKEVAGGIPEGAGGPLPPGTRGLIVSQLRVEGVVRENTTNKMIAVVTNETKRAYFLTENDTVYNGVVSKITPDAVYFKENVLDQEGRVSTREVVKKLGSAPGEGR
jgi:hypothetical protein